MEIKDYKKSRFFKYDFQAIYQNMLQEVSNYKYSCFEEFTFELEEYVNELLCQLNLDCFPHPAKNPVFHVEVESFPVFIPEKPDGSGLKFPYIIGKVSSTYPLNYREKPSGLIFEDFSFLQVEFTLAHNLEDEKIYILFHTYHYGRIRDTKEVYFFRYDKESNYQVTEKDIHLPPEKLDYKPIYHFHGNSDDPHFQDNEEDWKKKIKDILNLLKINIPRFIIKYKECDYIDTEPA